MREPEDYVQSLKWMPEGLHLLDQRLLPRECRYLVVQDAAGVAEAIGAMVVRGAPAIGIAAAYGVALAARRRYLEAPSAWRQGLEEDLDLLAAARPTAVNLSWAIERMRMRLDSCTGDPGPALAEEARTIHDEDIRANRRMGELGADLLGEPGAVLTHCNTGSLATGGYGTALGVIRSAFAAGRVTQVFAGETRPWLQGARLTAWELQQDGIPVTLLVDSAGAHLLRQGSVGWVIVGADRIAANGDVANKIGTYSLAVLARHHGVRFMVVAPTSTIDPNAPTGDHIPIEQRAAEEVLSVMGRRVAPTVEAWNPAFDITPAKLIDAIVTERGVLRNPASGSICALLDAEPVASSAD